MKFNSIHNNFTSGEWSDKMDARNDTEQYYKACKRQKNSICQMQGGSFKRGGTEYIKIVDGGGGTDAFSLNTSSKRFLFPYTAKGEKYVIFANDELPTSLGPRPWFAVNTVTQIRYPILATAGADFKDSEIESAQFTQVGDVLFFVTGKGIPRLIKRGTGALPSFTLETILDQAFTSEKYWKGIPFGPMQALSIDGTITVQGASFALGATVTLAATKEQFTLDMAPTPGGTHGGFGALFKFIDGSSTGVVAIASVTNSFSATATVIKVVPGAEPKAFGAAAGTAFQKARWNSSEGWPRTIAQFQGRLFYGGTDKYPDYVWGSRIGNIYEMAEIPDTDEAIFTTFSQDNSRAWETRPMAAENSNIQGLSSAKTLVINSERAEIVAFGSNGALGPNDFNFESSTSYGASRVQPVRVNNYLTFAQRGGRKIRDVIFNFTEDQYESNDLGFVSDHLTQGTEIKQMAGAELLSSVLFCMNHDGKLNAVTLDRKYQVNSWATIEIAGSHQGLHAKVLALCVVPAAGSQGQDGVFFLVQRTIDGSDVVYLERLAPFYEESSYSQGSLKFFYYMDSWAHISQSASSTVPGLEHLEGEEVQVFADGQYVGTTFVSNGEVFVGTPASEILVGLAYESEVTPKPIETGAQVGNAQGKVKRVNDLYIRFFNSGGCSYGNPNTGVFYDIPFRDPVLNPLPQPLRLFTGGKLVSFPSGYSREYLVTVKSSLPFPCNVVGIVAQGVTYD